jgi:hypothetical protein
MPPTVGTAAERMRARRGASGGGAGELLCLVEVEQVLALLALPLVHTKK